MKIAEGSIVELEYELFDPEGKLIESSLGEEAVEFVQGSGEVLPGLEDALLGQQAGAELEVTLPPAAAYGDYNPDGIVSVPRAQLPGDLELEVDDWITVVVRGDDDGGDEDEEGELEMRVVELGAEDVVLDANHPLAGKDVTFRLRVVSVRAGD